LISSLAKNHGAQPATELKDSGEAQVLDAAVQLESLLASGSQSA